MGAGHSFRIVRSRLEIGDRIFWTPPRPDQTDLGNGPEVTGPDQIRTDWLDRTVPDWTVTDWTRPDWTGPTRLDWTRREPHRGAPMEARGAPVVVFNQRIA